MSDTRQQAIEAMAKVMALAEKATPGEWKVNFLDVYAEVGGGWPDQIIARHSATLGKTEYEQFNAAFICAAVNFIRACGPELRAEVGKLVDVLHRKGFVRCDIPACNCGSWHHRYGLPERFREISEALRDAGVLDNSTGNLELNAVNKLAAERDQLRAEVEALRAFAQDVFSDWPEACGLYWFDVQDLAEKHGLLRPEERTEPCGENCNCAEYGDFPQTCFRKTPLLTGKPAAIDAAMKGEG